MNTNACAFTGHRPTKFSFGYDEKNEKCIRLKMVMAQQISALIKGSVSTFYTGMALGVDQWAAEIILDLKRQHPHIKLIAVLPCEAQADKWSSTQRDRYFDGLLPRCDDVITLQGKYTPDCMHKRNRYMVDRSNHLLAVYDGDGRGGTAYTVRYAQGKGREILVIHPDTLEVVSGVDLEVVKQQKQLRILPKKQGHI
ncbi:DUF1273 domain-containing protein [Christensenella minuta]|uniref:DUF1273 domain-containing protein n=1 Tax=Christensenella minuta TaxID=626937 RepID=UPI0021574872|nr:DUF1273 domain-containing protein [Christensenella minuta]